MPVIFDQYVNRKAGSSALADWLNEQGYSTKNGRLWSSASVITVLRNRGVLGEIYYRGNWYPAPHDPLIPNGAVRPGAGNTHRARRRSLPASVEPRRVPAHRPDTLRALRASRMSAPPLTDATAATPTTPVSPGHGTAPSTARNDRLPAERLEQAVTRRLWKVLDDHDLIDHAITETYERVIPARRRAAGELAACRASSQRPARRWTATSARSRPARCPRTPAPHA